MKNILSFFALALLLCFSCSSSNDDVPGNGEGDNGETLTSTALAKRNTERAIELIDNAVECYFTGNGMAMSRYYNPYSGKKSDELGSVWMYTSSIEAVNAVLHALEALKENGEADLYNAHFSRYTELLAKLYEGGDYYQGTFELVSYTQTKKWTVYGVNRGSDKGAAEVAGIMNVYDDQMWLIREFIEAYKATGDAKYLEKAEYLTDYVLDGWDCALDGNGNQYGGITWGPGYVTKHSCSNGPMVSPLVWLHEIYKGKADEVTYGRIAADNSRYQETAKKADYYLEMAKAVYAYQKNHLYDASIGVYSDMMGGDDTGGQVAYETVDGVKYRKHTNLRDRVGRAYSYNTGTMISGAADLYRATNDEVYLTDLKNLTDDSFAYFARLGETKPEHYTFDIDGFNTWFNGVLMRGYVDACTAYSGAASCAEAFQKNLDYAYSNYLYKNMLPVSLLVGWNRDQGKNNVEGMFTFTFAAEYAVLAKHELKKH